MAKRYCAICGEKLTARRRTFCSKKCQLRAFAIRRGMSKENAMKVEFGCKYNPGVDCESCVECDYCGWNPKVAEERLKQYVEVTE